jgi:hypothetical protein
MTRDSELLPPPSTEDEAQTLDPVAIAEGAALATLRGLLPRLSTFGFEPPPRLVLAIEPEAMQVLIAATLVIREVRPVPRVAITALPQAIGTLWLGEGAVLEIIGLPLDESFSPLWGMILPGASAVVLASAGDHRLLRAYCELTEIRLFRGDELLDGRFDIRQPDQIAAVLRAAVEKSVGEQT